MLNACESEHFDKEETPNIAKVGELETNINTVIPNHGTQYERLSFVVSVCLVFVCVPRFRKFIETSTGARLAAGSTGQV